VGEFDQPALATGKTISFNVSVDINASSAVKEAVLSVVAVPKHNVEEYSTKNNHAVAHVKLHN
jgi:hypothetical protein